MAISFVAAGAVSTGANSTVGVPAGLQAFDLLLIVTTGTATPSTPSGWTQVAAQGAGQFISVFYKITTTGTESSVTLTQTGSTSKSVMLAYRGCGSYDVVGTFTNPTGTTVTAQSQTTRLANDFVLCVYGNVSGGARTWTAPASTTARVNSSTTSTVTGMLIVDETKATAGATTARTATISASSALSGVQISIREPQTLYWTGTGNWSSTTLWKTSSGGATTIGAPTQNDNVVFDSNGTSCTIGSASACTNFTVDGTFAGTIAGTSTLAIAGSYVEDVSGGFTWSYSGSVTFNATTTGKTLTTNVGNFVAFTNSNITFNGLGGGWTVGGLLGGSTKTLTLTAGALDLNDNYLGFTTFTASGSAVRSLNSGPTQLGTIGLLANSGTVVTLNGTNITVTGSITYECVVASVSASARTIDLNSVYTESNAPSLILYNSNDTPTITAPIVKNLYFYDTGTGTSTISNSARTIYGGVSINSSRNAFTFSAGTNAWTFAATSGDPSTGTPWYIQTNGKTLDFPITFNGVSGSWALIDALTVGSTRTVTLTNGTLDLNNLNLTCGFFTITGSPTLAFGTGQMYITASGTTVFTQTSTATITGTPVVNLTYSGGTGARTVSTISVTEANSISFNVTAGTDQFQHSNIAGIRNLDFTGFSGTWGNNTGTIYGNLTLSTGMTVSAGTSTRTFGATSGTKTITSNGKTLDFPVTFNGVGGTWQLVDALTVGTTRAIALTAGTLNLNNNNLTTGSFSSNNTNARTIAPGTGQIYITYAAAATLVNIADMTNYVATGEVIFNLTGNSTTSSRTINVGSTAGGSETYAPSVVVSAGSDQVLVTYISHLKNVTFTSGFTGSPQLRTYIYGNLSIASSITGWVADPTNAIYFAATSGTKTIDTNGVTINQNIQFVGAGGSWQLLSNWVNTQSYIRFQYGTFNANGFNVTTPSVQSNYSTTRSINLGSGTWTLTGSGTVWTSSTTTGLTLTATSSTIVLQDNSTTARIFSASPTTTFNNLVFDGSNVVTTTMQFASTWLGTWSSTKTSAFTITLPSSLTTTVGNWTISGTAGNLVTLNSSTAGTRANLSKASGTVNVSYMDIKDSNATGGATWNSPLTSGNVDSGNNLGWLFGAAPGGTSSNFFLLF